MSRPNRGGLDVCALMIDSPLGELLLRWDFLLLLASNLVSALKLAAFVDWNNC